MPDQLITDPRRRRLVLVVVALALMMVVSAVSGLNVALPDLAVATGATQTQLQWIVDAYTVVFAGLLLFAGAVGDRYGRRGTLVAGLVVFGAAAAVALVTTDPQTIIAVRAVMGVGAALTMPTTLSIITTSFPEEERGRAVGLWVGVAGGGAVLGLFASGLLLQWFSWSSFFALNVTLAVLALAGTLAFVPGSRDDHPPALDALSALLSLIGVSGLVFGIIEGPTQGWGDPMVVGALVVGVVALALFVLRELRKDSPMLDPRLFTLRGFGTGSASLTVQFFAAFGFFFITLQYLQFVVGLSPLMSAVCLLPLPFVLIPLARQAPRLADRFGFRRIASLGLVSMAIGFLVISRIQVDLAYWLFAIGLVFFAIGMALAATPATTAIVRSLPAAKQGVASAVNDTSREFGSAIGIAVLGSVLNSAYRSGMTDAVAGLPDRLAQAALDSVAFVSYAPLDQLGPRGAALAAAAKQSFVDGVSAAVVVGSVVLLVAAAFVAWRGTDGSNDAGDGADAAEAAAPGRHTTG
ncbi:MAG: MFS transporter [Frankiales bacterium]|nr:MFS transporter [Frankiales bacterium]